MREEITESARSGPGRPRTFDREAALGRALELFWDQGYMQTSIAQLCGAMGIKSPSLYCAFGSKAELFLEALSYYREKYWRVIFERFLNSNNLYEATKNLLESAARILLLPDAPCGCLTVFSALTLPPSEIQIHQTISAMRAETKKIFRDRLRLAIRQGEIAPDTNIPVIAASLTNYFEGLTLQAREEDICQAELIEIALRGVLLLPPILRK